MTIPKIQNSLTGWESEITLIKIVDSIDDDGLKVETETQIVFQGVIQPFKPEQNQVKAEGKRSWESWQVHTKTEQSLTTGDKVIYLDQRFEVEAKSNYEINGYFEYHLLKDYES